ncbi:hypothetical protein BCR32DRAFT_276989 [Anaeromyces robustus]|uniref:Uncharacterized protein n=1 Tax=Anaeromyces robustus TaxID=1754192 RepID=A0A1Y1XFQ4_9FUNG|nr:hypothetical protein BCR32DRAFT_276989 [Anaeromyces robustus]|eukprot:ORX84601.1 hypothetical protein BCR32DRAFT_276989 [Anaeromyces robustus]
MNFDDIIKSENENSNGKNNIKKHVKSNSDNNYNNKNNSKDLTSSETENLYDCINKYKNMIIKTCITEKFLFFLDSMKIKNDINIANNTYYNLNFINNYILVPIYNNKFVQDSIYYRINGKEISDIMNFLNNTKIMDKCIELAVLKYLNSECSNKKLLYMFKNSDNKFIYNGIIKDSFLNIRYFRNKDKLKIYTKTGINDKLVKYLLSNKNFTINVSLFPIIKIFNITLYEKEIKKEVNIDNLNNYLKNIKTMLIYKSIETKIYDLSNIVREEKIEFEKSSLKEFNDLIKNICNDVSEKMNISIKCKSFNSNSYVGSIF